VSSSATRRPPASCRRPSGRTSNARTPVHPAVPRHPAVTFGAVVAAVLPRRARPDRVRGCARADGLDQPAVGRGPVLHRGDAAHRPGGRGGLLPLLPDTRARRAPTWADTRGTPWRSLRPPPAARCWSRESRWPWPWPACS
jgi:hypothetical protein